MTKNQSSKMKLRIIPSLKITFLVIITSSSICHAEDSKQVTELKKHCEELSKETGEKYIYGSGKLKSFYQVDIFVPPPPPTPEDINIPNTLVPPLPFMANFIADNNKTIKIIISASWDRLEASRERKPIIPVSMEVGKKYALCYKEKQSSSRVRYNIDHPETQIIKE